MSFEIESTLLLYFVHHVVKIANSKCIYEGIQRIQPCMFENTLIVLYFKIKAFYKINLKCCKFVD
jgi:hypothetical protein